MAEDSNFEVLVRTPYVSYLTHSRVSPVQVMERVSVNLQVPKTLYQTIAFWTGYVLVFYCRRQNKFLDFWRYFRGLF